MTVQELIAELSKMPPGHAVKVMGCESGAAEEPNTVEDVTEPRRVNPLGLDRVLIYWKTK